MSVKEDLEKYAVACGLARKEARYLPAFTDVSMREQDLARANLTYLHMEHGNFRKANLRGATLSHARVNYGTFQDADLCYAEMSNCSLVAANLTGANLSGAVLVGTKLHGATLHNTNLNNALLEGVVLVDAKGIRSAGPVGRQRRMIYGVSNDAGAMIQAGCWWASLECTLRRVALIYDGDPLRDDYLAAVKWVGAVTYTKD